MRATFTVCMLSAPSVHCANVMWTAICIVFLCPVCFVHKPCTAPVQLLIVRAACTMCNAECARCALCKWRSAQYVSVPRLLYAQAVWMTPSLCNVRAACKVCNARCAKCVVTVWTVCSWPENFTAMLLHNYLWWEHAHSLVDGWKFRWPDAKPNNMYTAVNNFLLYMHPVRLLVAQEHLTSLLWRQTQ